MNKHEAGTPKAEARVRASCRGNREKPQMDPDGHRFMERRSQAGNGTENPAAGSGAGSLEGVRSICALLCRSVVHVFARIGNLFSVAMEHGQEARP
jgi:hypothetical protein